MRHLIWTTSALALATTLGALGCGDSGGGDSEPNTDAIVYPDSLCGDDGCVANIDTAKTCDPNASEADLGDCNAWRIDGSFSLSAIKIDESAARGAPPPPMPMDKDNCPPNTQTPDGKTVHCCERITVQADKPAFMLTGIDLTAPPTFKGGSVGTTNKDAIETDRYNWIMELSSDQPGKLQITSGLGLQNKDGSFAFARGPFTLGGVMWNKKGEWDPHVVDGILEEDGTLKYAGQYMPKGRYFQLPLWGVGYGFTMMVLSMTGIEMSIKLDSAKLCGGYLTGYRDFDKIGEIKAYLPLEPLRKVVLHFEAGDSGASICQITAQVRPGDCDKPVEDWGK